LRAVVSIATRSRKRPRPPLRNSSRSRRTPKRFLCCADSCRNVWRRWPRPDPAAGHESWGTGSSSPVRPARGASDGRLGYFPTTR
jgi:hypothetical protein